MRSALLVLTVFLLSAISALAADISGKWKGVAEGPQGKIERTFIFKVDGNKLTGETTSEMLGKSDIKDGKIDGENVSFHISANLQGEAMELTYQGKVVGSEIHLSVEAPTLGQKIEWVLKRG